MRDVHPRAGPGEDAFGHLGPTLVRLDEETACRKLGTVLWTVDPWLFPMNWDEGPQRVRHLTLIRCPAYARLLPSLLVSRRGEQKAESWPWSRLLGDRASWLGPDTRFREAAGRGVERDGRLAGGRAAHTARGGRLGSEQAGTNRLLPAQLLDA